MTTQLSFLVSEQLDAETDKPTQYGTFSSDWAEEDVLDELIDSLEAGRISHKQGLLRAHKLLVKFPGQLEIKNFIANQRPFLLAHCPRLSAGADLKSYWPGARSRRQTTCSYFVNELTDDLSKAMVKRIQNRARSKHTHPGCCFASARHPYTCQPACTWHASPADLVQVLRPQPWPVPTFTVKLSAPCSRVCTAAICACLHTPAWCGHTDWCGCAENFRLWHSGRVTIKLL
jgi:hypothetical protein